MSVEVTEFVSIVIAGETSIDELTGGAAAGVGATTAADKFPPGFDVVMAAPKGRMGVGCLTL